MIIVDRNTFLAMPAGTVYAKYKPCVFGELSIKGDTIAHDGKPIDWYYVDLISIESTDSGDWADKLDAAERRGASLPIDFEIESRDGMFDERDLFAVFERADVEALIDRLKRTL